MIWPNNHPEQPGFSYGVCGLEFLSLHHQKTRRENAIQQTEDGARENWHWDGVQHAMLPRSLGDLSATYEPWHERILANSAVYSTGSHRRAVW